jgi:hypothetical protein
VIVNSSKGSRIRIAEGQLRQIVREELSHKYFGIPDNIDEMVSELRDLERESRRYDIKYADRQMTDIGRKYGVSITYVASGTARFTVALGSDLILKIARGPGAVRMNRDDYTLGVDPSLGGAFVRAYDHAPDWSWILLERVQVINDDKDFVDLFPNEMLPSLEDVATSSDVDRRVSRFPEQFYVDVIQAFLSQDPAREFEIYPPLRKNLLAVMRIRNPNLKEIGDGEIMSLLAAFNRHRGFRSIRKAVVKHGVAPVEVRAGNVGLTPEGDAVMIDSSMTPN